MYQLLPKVQVIVQKYISYYQKYKWLYKYTSFYQKYK